MHYQNFSKGKNREFMAETLIKKSAETIKLSKKQAGVKTFEGLTC